MCQIAHLQRDNGEAAPALARPRRLDPGIQGKQVGLEGNLVDRPDNAFNLPGRGFQALHRHNRLLHDMRNMLRIFRNRTDKLARLARAFGRFLDRRGDLRQGRRALVDRVGLLFRPMRQAVRGSPKFLGLAAHAQRAVADLLHRRLQPIQRTVEIR